MHAVGLTRAKRILAVSSVTKQEIMDHFPIDPSKIVVTYEGVDTKISNFKFQISNKNPIISEPYFLYVGNAYPHKDLETLVKAFQLISQGLALPGKARPYEAKDIHLVLVGKDDFFYRRLKEEVKKMGLESNIIFFGEASDSQLANLYAHALALVFPSKMEGFGLPAIEALSLGCPVIASDIAVFHEILQHHAVYFPPGDDVRLAALLTTALKGNIVKPQIGEIAAYLSSFQWPVLVRATLAAYEDCIGIRSGN